MKMRREFPFACNGQQKQTRPMLKVATSTESETGQNEIWLYGDIWDVLGLDDWLPDEFITPSGFKDALDSFKGEPVTLRIHSPGGDVFGASAIRSLIMTYPGEITARIDGLCASAATFIATAANKILMQDTGFFMIHNPWTIAWGETDDFKAVIKALNEIKKGIVEGYLNHSNLDQATIEKMMNDETWMSAGTALEYGFIDEIVKDPVTKTSKNLKRSMAKSMANSLQAFRNVPDDLQLLDENVTEEPVSSDPAETSDAEPDQGNLKRDKAVQALRDKIKKVQEGETNDIQERL